MRVLGSITSILLLGAIGAVLFGGLGLLTASRAQNIESVSGLINVEMMLALNDAFRATILQARA